MSNPQDNTAIDNLSIPFPMQNGKLARLFVPPSMSVEDAQRLKRVINALYINGQQLRKGN